MISFRKRESVYIIAEIGNNHEGDFQLAEELIGLAAKCGADAVKFQTIEPEYFVTSSDKNRIEQLNKFKFTRKQFLDLSEIAAKEQIDFISTPFDLQSAIFLNGIQESFKISSGDNDFYKLIETVASFGKNIILSTGLSTIDEIKKTVLKIQQIWQSMSSEAELALLHCVSSYPVPTHQANLAMIQRLSKEFEEVTIGYSDHTLGIQAAVASVACGAKIVEKHFTIDKNYSSFRDHQLSSDPEEMKVLVQRIREMEQLMGNYSADVMEVEKEISTAMRRSIAAASNLAAGQIIGEDDITWVRPGSGFRPGEENRVLGKKTNKSIDKGQIFKADDFL